jgi:hypothetical protein
MYKKSAKSFTKCPEIEVIAYGIYKRLDNGIEFLHWNRKIYPVESTAIAALKDSGADKEGYRVLPLYNLIT